MIEFLALLTFEASLEAVKQNGYALRYVKDQTEAVALEAVKQNGYALQYVKDQTEAVALEAVKQDGYALQFVKDQTEAVALEAVKQDVDALRYVLKKSLFIRLATHFKISINIKDQTANAVKAYAAYCKQAGGVTFDGKPLPTFEELGDDRQACWIAAADAL